MKQFRDTPYYVTENGEVYRLWKTGFKKRKPVLNSDGYHIVSTCQFGIKKFYRVHRIVAECYIPNPNNLPEVNHDDANKINNHVSNLYWCTHAENMEHAWNNKLIKPPKGQRHTLSKLKDEDIIWIRQNYILRHPKFGTIPLSKKFNVSYSLISRIIKNKCWSHINPEQSSEYE